MTMTACVYVVLGALQMHIDGDDHDGITFAEAVCCLLYV